jgi:hypothetical protein
MNELGAEFGPRSWNRGERPNAPTGTIPRFDHDDAARFIREAPSRR